MGLRGIVAQTILKHINIYHKPAVEALVEEYHSLAIALVRLQAMETLLKP
jgi:hypothetical protein